MKAKANMRKEWIGGMGRPNAAWVPKAELKADRRARRARLRRWAIDFDLSLD